MATAVGLQQYDITDERSIFRRSVQLGILTGIFVLVFSLAMRFLDGVAELAVCGPLLLAGMYVLYILPGLWTKARTIEGIAGAAGIGLGSAVVFLVIDVVLLQWIGTYTNRFLELGGGSNWWYHPVWWMLGSYVPWMGAFAMSFDVDRTGAPAPTKTYVTAIVVAAVLMVAGYYLHFPGATLSLGAFAVAFFPAVGIVTGLASLGRAKS